jgi:hypothetical protein
MSDFIGFDLAVVQCLPQMAYLAMVLCGLPSERTPRNGDEPSALSIGADQALNARGADALGAVALGPLGAPIFANVLEGAE